MPLVTTSPYNVIPTEFTLLNPTFNQSFSTAGEDTQPTDVFFTSDGLKMFVAGSQNERIYEYDLSSAWDVSTASFIQNVSINPPGADPHGMTFKPDGLNMFVNSANQDRVFEFDLAGSPEWNITTATYNSVNVDVSSQGAFTAGIRFKTDGSILYVADASLAQPNNKIHEYTVSTPWDLSTASFSQSTTTASTNGLISIDFKSDGTKMFALNQNIDSMQEYSLGTAWDLSTLSLQNTYSFTGDVSLAYGVFLKPDGTKMYITSLSPSRGIFEYDL